MNEITQEQMLESLSGFRIKRNGNLMSHFIPKSEAHIVSKIKDFSANDQKRLLTGQLKTIDTAIYVASEITGASSIFEMINGASKEVGVCSLDKGVIPTGENYSIDYLRLTFAIVASNSPLTVKDVNYGTGGSSYFTPLLNADISIWADNKLVAELPISIFNMDDSSPYRDLKLEKPLLLKSNEQLEIKIEYPKGVSMNVDRKSFLKVLLKGIKTTKR